MFNYFLNVNIVCARQTTTFLSVPSTLVDGGKRRGLAGFRLERAAASAAGTGTGRGGGGVVLDPAQLTSLVRWTEAAWEARSGWLPLAIVVATVQCCEGATIVP